VARIGILNLGLHGHLRPLSRLGRALAAQGHAVVAWAPEEVRDVIEQGGVELRAEGEISQEEPIHNVVFGAAIAASRTVDEVEPVIEQLHRDRIDLVVYDCMFPAGRLAAEWLGLPRVCSVPLFPPGSGQPPAREVADETSAADPSDEELIEVLHGVRDELGLKWGVELGGLRDVVQNPGDLNLVYTTPEVAGTTPRDDSWRFVGPLLDPVEAPSAREPSAPPLVYMALGTLFSNQPAVFRAALEGLADVDVRVLIGTGGRLAPEDLEPVPDNATVERWPDGRAALREAAVAITHGGIGSVHEALAAAVPMLCLPQGGDQWSWAKRMVELGVGQVLSDLTPATVRAAVTELLRADEARQRAAELAAHLAGYPGTAIAADAVQSLLDG
jgi:demethyllactenocin mycarosyltransferase